jgi:Fe-S-cluster containining protein
MARHKLPLFTERTIAETKADQIDGAQQFASQLGVVSCREGCSNCCHHAVHATIPEGILAYQALSGRGLWTPSLRRRLEDHASFTWDLAPEVWHLSNIPCPLLEKNRCIIYDARPFACRVTFATGDPAGCHPHRVNDPSSSVVPKLAALTSFVAKQTRLLKRHRLNTFMMSFSKTVLYGEKFATGAVDLESLGQLLAKDFAK